MVSDDADRGGLFGPIRSMQRSLVRGGLSVQRQLADDVLESLETMEDFSRRTRLSSHYSAVRAVDRLEDVHPADDASLDPLYDGVGQTFDALADADDQATTVVSDAVERTADVTEELGEQYLEASETTCDPVVEWFRDPLVDADTADYPNAASDD